jgi:hypothetical protein
MSKRLVVVLLVVVAAAMLSPRLRAQDEKWNNIPPTRDAYRNWKPSGVAPKRDLTGIWDTVQTLGTSGILEHPALYPGRRGQEGGHEDETGIEHPLPYTPAGLAALKKNKPSGRGCVKWTRC